MDVHQNATLSDSFEGGRSRVIDNLCNAFWLVCKPKPFIAVLLVCLVFNDIIVIFVVCSTG